TRMDSVVRCGEPSSLLLMLLPLRLREPRRASSGHRSDDDRRAAAALSPALATAAITARAGRSLGLATSSRFPGAALACIGSCSKCDAGTIAATGNATTSISSQA